jgi:hypothetical protein
MHGKIVGHFYKVFMVVGFSLHGGGHRFFDLSTGA